MNDLVFATGHFLELFWYFLLEHRINNDLTQYKFAKNHYSIKLLKSIQTLILCFLNEDDDDHDDYIIA